MNELPDNEHLQQARELFVYDASGQKVRFGDLLNTNGKTIVIFIRSFNIKSLITIGLTWTPSPGHFFGGVRDISRMTVCPATESNIEFSAHPR